MESSQHVNSCNELGVSSNPFQLFSCYGPYGCVLVFVLTVAK